MIDTRTPVQVPEDRSRLLVLTEHSQRISRDRMLGALRNDMVVLRRNVSAEEAEGVVYQVADGFGLGHDLSLQAGFVSLYRHRHSIGRYFMSVNERRDFQFVPPHSEGSRGQPLQLAAFFCYENSTDGGESILMNVAPASDAWPSLREQVRRGRLRRSGALSDRETKRARGQYFLSVPADLLKDDDQILDERETEIPGLSVLTVLARLERLHSRILGADVYVYWDSVASIDVDAANEYWKLLKESGLLREPSGGLDLEQLDSQAARRIWRSGVHFSQLFTCRITLKLAPGDLILHNNLTWTHAASNWSAGTGTRRIAAAFA